MILHLIRLKIKKKKKGKGTYIFAGCNLVYVFSICEDNVLSILPMLT